MPIMGGSFEISIVDSEDPHFKLSCTGRNALPFTHFGQSYSSVT